MPADARDETWSFRCSACGKCCNSAPEVSVPELFHHQGRFIGCLAIRRVPRLRSGDRLGQDPLGPTANEMDCRAHSELADAVLHRLPGHAGDILLATHGFTLDPSDACPALGSDMRCTVHDDRKPAACSVVPLDALVPDRLQHVVLAERREQAEYLGADCIVRGSRPGSSPITRRLVVVDPEASAALARRRQDLADEKRRWGDAVFGMFRAELFASPSALARVPVGGFLVMAIAPVLMVLAAVSPRCRLRCVEYIDAQIVLIEERIRLALLARRPGDPAGIAQLQAFARTNRALRAALEEAAPRASARTPADGRETETWMGLAEPTS